MFAVVVLALSVTAVVGVVSAARSQGAATGDIASSQDLARELMEEITARPFADPQGPSVVGAEADEPNRTSYDNVDDYHGYADTLSRVEGRETKQFKRSVTVQYRATPQGVAMPTGDFVVVEVTVTGPDNRTVTLSQLITAACARR